TRPPSRLSRSDGQHIVMRCSGTALPEMFPKDNSCADGDIDRVFASELRDFQCFVQQIQYRIADTIHFVAEDECSLLACMEVETVQCDTIFGLFHGDDPVA
ncbi:MAG: hypothetical protein RL021_1781, partial [Bacteroidota bacterium]